MGLRGPMSRRRERMRTFWREVSSGASTPAAADAAGVSYRQAWTWFRQRGGMASSQPCGPPSGRYLGWQERDQIALLRAQGCGVNQIAIRLGRSPSTISRELSRNSTGEGVYAACAAQRRADGRLARPKTSKIAATPQLRAAVHDKLLQRWSPRQIAVCLTRSFPDNQHMQVSHESIYRSLYVQGRGELRRELTKCLRTGRSLRKPRARVGTDARGQLVDLVKISQRPPEAADRAVPGHWEGDLIIGRAGASAIATLVERTTRFNMLLHLPGHHDAITVRDALIAAIESLPQHLWRSLTWDRGKELSRHREITIAKNLPIYFCDPHSPWQRGSNENFNGLARQYFPKGTDLSVHSPQELSRVSAEINNRPRQTLDWKTPAEALNELLSHPYQPTVATTA